MRFGGVRPKPHGAIDFYFFGGGSYDAMAVYGENHNAQRYWNVIFGMFAKFKVVLYYICTLLYKVIVQLFMTQTKQFIEKAAHCKLLYRNKRGFYEH